MCAKLADGEIASMKTLMATVLNAVVIDVFGLERSEIKPEAALIADLHMTPAQQSKLAALVAEYFDGQRLEIGAGTTLGDVYAQVIGP